MKNRSFSMRLGFACSGIRHVWRCERSFRSQSLAAILVILGLTATRPPLIWTALVLIQISMVLALEANNSALEYALDHLHPDVATPIGRSKDAAAGAVLITSATSIVIGALLLVALISRSS